jgi:integrase-like protein
VAHESSKNFQLDLFTPDDGHYEYAAAATNLALDLRALYAFICGREAQEKTLAELKGEFALDVVPTAHYGANSAWQQLSILADNLARNFQLYGAAKLPDLRFHDLRHTFASRLAMAGVDLYTVQRTGGWKTNLMVQRYVHLSPDHIRAAVEKLAATEFQDGNRHYLGQLAIQSWSLTSLQQRLFKTGGRLIRHARYFILPLAESQLTQRLFAQIIRRIERLAWHPK